MQQSQALKKPSPSSHRPYSLVSVASEISTPPPSRVFTLPNLVSCFRIFLSPFIVYWIMVQQHSWVLGGLILAALSDGVDGFLARRFKDRSSLGAYLDPAADKILLNAVIVSYTLWGPIPLGLCLMLLLRDLLIVGGVLVFHWKKIPFSMKPAMSGKLNTVLEFGLLACIALSFVMPVDPQWLLYLMSCVMITLVISSVQYGRMAMGASKKGVP